VRAPKGFAEAYRHFVEGGWGALSADPHFGGQGLPRAIELATFENDSQRKHGLWSLSHADARGYRSIDRARHGTTEEDISSQADFGRVVGNYEPDRATGGIGI